MKIGIIKTDGGEHSPELMASVCAGQIMSIDPSKMAGPKLIAAQQLELAVTQALIRHHTGARDAVRDELKANAAAHFARPDLHDPGARLDQALADVTAAAVGTPWESEFADETKRAAIRQVIGQFLVDMAHLERLYHADREPGDAAARAYRATPTGTAVIREA
jgi:hypothetical protein